MSIRTFAVALSATLALIAGPVTLPSASAADGPPSDPALSAAPANAPAAAFDDSTPEALVASAVKALKANDLLAFFHRLPIADQAKMQEAWTRMTGNQFMTGMVDRRIPQLTGETLTTAVVAALTGADLAALGARLKAFAGTADPSAAPADPNQPAQGGGGFGGFGGGRGGPGGGGGPLMPWFEGVATELVDSTLASGMETQQTESYQAVVSALGDWAAKSPLTDKDKATAFAGELSSAVEALGIKTGNDLTATTVSDLITKMGESVRHLKAGLAKFDLQADAALDTVKLSDVKPIGSATDTVSAILHVTALGAERSLAMKFVKKDGHWNVAADSPLLAWLRNPPRLTQMLMFGGGRGGPGGPGGQGGGRNRGQRPGGQGGQGGQAPAGQAPAGQDANPAAPKPNPGF